MSDQKSRYLSRRSFLTRTGAFAATLMVGRLALAQGAKTSKFNSDLEMAINFEIQQTSGGRYQRPYVAVWIENASGYPVRTVSLWIENSGKGLRYVRELRRWYQDETTRSGKDGGDLISTVSSSTRNAGKYTVVWDGKNDRKALVDQGEYYICVEESREHGPYQLVRKKVTVGDAALKETLGSDGELKDVSIELRKRK
ncbi:DUF2271 domain-containing protein [Deinococcus roseus]|uniref:DUF2271 domain-containing protein n=1 Tax=Deinococcus roseus TaxID=392414 RepID=A0ABQ2CWS2_9DEIO|nr:DUF2271 domain-containing protein [Deinococcus roseus]GGJ28747.1 hypothetical protein GCM10008938_13520 [Deinococcus roseus]